jgi:hypothetical protein
MEHAAPQLMKNWLSRQLSAEQSGWLDEQLAKISADPSLRNVQIAFGMVPRRLSKDDLQLQASDFEAASQAREGWQPLGWSVDIAARILLLLEAGKHTNQFPDMFVTMCRYADVAEAVALYSGLPFFPDQPALEAQAGEGLRANMRSIFEAIAHNNPFPREQFDENRWNHMILKALFVESKLDPIQGLDERANPELARIVRDYAHERWAASRPITAELWRCIGPFADGDVLADLERVMDHGDANEKNAAALALSASPSPQAHEMLKRLPDQHKTIQNDQLTWHILAQSI